MAERSTATGASRVSTTGTTRQASYTSNFAPALRLFDDLIAMRQGHLTAYRKAHQLLTTWLKRFPITNNRWGPFFEDVPTHDYSDTEINAETLAWYILQRRAEWDPAWRRQVVGILSWVDATFSDTSWARYGVIATREQTDYPVPGNSHTARHASVELAFCQATGDCARAPGAVRRLNWATYMVDADGKNYYPTNDIWLTDGYGDYVRHYLRAMAADPDLAPADANHLLSTSSVVQAIDYGSSAITYTKFDRRSVERFKLGAWAPRSVDGGTMRWNTQAKVVEIQGDAATVTIRGS